MIIARFPDDESIRIIPPTRNDCEGCPFNTSGKTDNLGCEIMDILDTMEHKISPDVQVIIERLLCYDSDQVYQTYKVLEK